MPLPLLCVPPSAVCPSTCGSLRPLDGKGRGGEAEVREGRVVRLLGKAFPNRVNLLPPHGEAALSEW